MGPSQVSCVCDGALAWRGGGNGMVAQSRAERLTPLPPAAAVKALDHGIRL
jgi:hypothetical protein